MTMFRVAGAVRIDLRCFDERVSASWLRDDWQEITRRMQQACDAPNGAEIVFLVAPGQMAPPTGASWIRENGQHLGRITVECSDPGTVKRWVVELRGEEAA